MITVTMLLLFVAFLCAVLALLSVYERVNLTAIGLLCVVLVLLLGNVHS